MLLEGRVVFVTGAARGIGRGIAVALAESGAEVALGDLDLAAASETAELVRDRGRRAVALKLDVTDRASLDEAIARCAEALGPMDGSTTRAPSACRRPDAATTKTPSWR
jgi:NAD(P)-dependent dehydrogenase (short-subunit alcohol dehydrogenase family)